MISLEDLDSKYTRYHSKSHTLLDNPRMRAYYLQENTPKLWALILTHTQTNFVWVWFGLQYWGSNLGPSYSATYSVPARRTQSLLLSFPEYSTSITGMHHHTWKPKVTLLHTLSKDKNNCEYIFSAKFGILCLFTPFLIEKRKVREL